MASEIRSPAEAVAGHDRVHGPDRTSVHPPDRSQAIVVADRIRVVGLGLNAWAVLLAVPLLVSQPTGPLSGLVVVPLVALFAGAAMLGRGSPIVDWLLLGVFPTLLAGLVAALPRLTISDPFPPLTLFLGTLSFAAYGAIVALAASRPTRLRRTQPSPLGPSANAQDKPRRALQRRTLLGVALLAGVVYAFVLPVLSREALEASFGPAAREASLLLAVSGCALACVMLALFVGPSLRASRSKPLREAQIRVRVAGLLAAVVLGLIAYYLLRETA